MSRPLRTEPEASAEMGAAARWYEDRRAGLGVAFLEAIDTALGRVAEWPHAGAPVPDVAPDLPVRRVPVAGFPYHVVYIETRDAIRILAIAHDRRLPGYWQSRIQR